MTRTVLLLMLAGSVVAGIESSPVIAQQTRADTTPAVTLPNTHLHVVPSRVNGRTYRLRVSLPSAYADAPPGDTARFPTLYLLDPSANESGFSLLYSFQLMARSKAILVAVSAIEPPGVQGAHREVDYMPPLTAADSQYFEKGRVPPLGGAPKFLRVLKEEIIPLIDRSYRTSGDRGIEGGSLGGLFVAYAMFEEPELFTRYSMISPSLWYPWGRENGMILTREPEFAKQHPVFRKTVYISVGSDENSSMIAVAWQFAKQLCLSLSKGYYKGMDLGAETIAGAFHVAPNMVTRGFNAAYPWDSVGARAGRGVMKDCH